MVVTSRDCVVKSFIFQLREYPFNITHDIFLAPPAVGYPILMKFYRIVPGMVLFRFLEKTDSFKNSGCHGNKTKKRNRVFENLLVRNHKA